MGEIIEEIEKRIKRGVKKRIFIRHLQTDTNTDFGASFNAQRGTAGAGNQVKSRRARSSQGESTGL